MRKGLWLSLAMVCMLVVGCRAESSSPTVETAPSPTVRIKQMVESMSLEEKVGQMLMVGIPSGRVDTTTIDFINKYKVGGIIHFDRNLASSNQVRSLNEALQNIAKKNKNPIGIYIAVDQEGGAVARMRSFLQVAPSAASIGAIGKPQVAEDWAYGTGQKLKALGFNVNFAPVADLNFTNGRSYGRSAETVTPYVQAAVAGYNKAGLTSSLKHFPGLGRVLIDPHNNTSRITATAETLRASDFVPFQAMVQHQDQYDYMVMVSHPVYTAFDSRPACVSSKLLEDLLRNEWGYRGIIITDDLDMGGLAKVYPATTRGVLAVQGGNDILLSCGANPHNSITIYRSVLEAVRHGKISEARIDASVERILQHKYHRGLLVLEDKE